MEDHRYCEVKTETILEQQHNHMSKYNNLGLDVVDRIT